MSENKGSCSKLKLSLYTFVGLAGVHILCVCTDLFSGRRDSSYVMNSAVYNNALVLSGAGIVLCGVVDRFASKETGRENRKCSKDLVDII
tara:strand:- start:167 stop:436 length:270 start_codon:yes stop_codon:yes gene_type:complete